MSSGHHRGLLRPTSSVSCLSAHLLPHAASFCMQQQKTRRRVGSSY